MQKYTGKGEEKIIRLETKKRKIRKITQKQTQVGLRHQI